MSENLKKSMLDLYEKHPYPYQSYLKNSTGTPLLTFWINANAPENQVLYNGCSILVAGCGTGQEAFELSKMYPDSEIIGVDFSPKSIQIARKECMKIEAKNIRFECFDLTDIQDNLPKNHFDFILCYGVADYVVAPKKLMQNLSNLLSERGILYLSVNSPYHPAKAIQSAFKSMEKPIDDFTENYSNRILLDAVCQLMKGHLKIPELSKASDNYLNVDIFPPVCHHFSIEEWEQLADPLNFVASLDGLTGINLLSDEHLRAFYGKDISLISKVCSKLLRAPGIQMIFSKRKKKKVDFENDDAILAWQPTLNQIIGPIPPLSKPIDTYLPLSLQYPGFTALTIHSKAIDLEIFRQFDGQKKISQILENLPKPYELSQLKPSLFRAYHYAVIF